MQARANSELLDAETGSAASSVINYFSFLHITGLHAMTSKRPLAAAMLNYLFMPMAALAAVFSAIFAWRQAYLDRNNGLTIARAVMETVAAAATIAAAATTIVLTAAYAFVGPVLMAGAIGLRSLFKAGEACYFAIKAHQSADIHVKAALQSKANMAATEAVVGTVIAASMVVLQIFVAPAMQLVATAVGLLASAIGFVAMRLSMEKLNQQSRAAACKEYYLDHDERPRHENTTTSRLAKEFGANSLIPLSTQEDTALLTAATQPPVARHCERSAAIQPTVSCRV